MLAQHLCARHCSEHCICITSFNPHHNPDVGAFIILSLQGGNRQNRIRNLPKIIQFVAAGEGFEACLLSLEPIHAFHHFTMLSISPWRL